MTTLERATVVGVFEDRVRAERALNALYRAGFDEKDVGFVIRDVNHTHAAPEVIQRDTAMGAATGAVSGGVVGGLLGAATALLIPGLGPALAGSILAVALGGAALGAAAGSFVGALTGFGVPEEEALYYQSEFELGRIIVLVRAPNRQSEALEILRQNGAYDAATRTSMGSTPLYASESSADELADPDATVKYPALNRSGEDVFEAADRPTEIQQPVSPAPMSQKYNPVEDNAWEMNNNPPPHALNDANSQSR